MKTSWKSHVMKGLDPVMPKESEKYTKEKKEKLSIDELRIKKDKM